jgi:predicted deacylase
MRAELGAAVRRHPGPRRRGAFLILWLVCALAFPFFPALADEGSEDDPEGAIPVPPGPVVERPVEPVEPAPVAWGPITVAGSIAEPGERVRGGLAASQSFAGIDVETPFVVSRGASPGPTLCLTGGIHGDELSGVEIVRRVVVLAEPSKLAGTLIAVPIANPHGFRRSSRYLPDRRDLNRYFPGRETGSAAARIANALFDGVVTRCDALVDFHTGSFHRTNAPHLRADLDRVDVARLVRQFGAEIVLHHTGQPGTLRRAATDRGIPCVTYEAGEPMRLNEPDVVVGVQGTLRLMRQLGMWPDESSDDDPEQEIYLNTRWVRVDAGGILRSRVELGQRVVSGEVLGSVVDPGSNRHSKVRAPFDGRVVGMAIDQVVIPGFAAYHVGVRGAAVGPEVPEVGAPSEPLPDPDGDDRPE